MTIPQRLLEATELLDFYERLLVVRTEDFVAAALFKKVDTTWYCMETAPPLRWMMGKSPEQIKQRLSKMRARWRFLANACTTEEGMDRMPSEREARGALTRQTTADPAHNNYQTGETRIPSLPEESYPDLKGERLRKPLDTASFAVVTCPPLATPEEQGVPPTRPLVVSESSLAE